MWTIIYSYDGPKTLQSCSSFIVYPSRKYYSVPEITLITGIVYH